MNAKNFFDTKLAPKLQANPACMQESGVKNKTIQIELEGSSGGAWAFRFDATGNVSLGAADPAADCTIWMKDETFEGLLHGKVNVPMAVAFRKIKIKGDAGTAGKLALSIQKMFKG
jgi:putative sterol carrier protein